VSDIDRLFIDAEPGRKGEILGAAADVFGEYGYDSGSMRQIAAHVGVSEPALYRHFSGKEAIFLALMRIGAGRLRDETLVLIGQLRPDGLRQQLIETLRDRRRSLRFYGPLLRIILPVAARNERFLAEYRNLVIIPARAQITETAADIDMALGVPNAEETRDARVRALLSLVVGYLVSSFVIGDEPDEAIVDAALRVMGWETPAAS
jgi:AcrR family transcriptional regulator